MPRGMLVKEERRLTYFFFFTSRPFVSLFTHPRFPPSLYVTQAQQALDFYTNYFILEIEGRSIPEFIWREIIPCLLSGIVNRNIDNYGDNVSAYHVSFNWLHIKRRYNYIIIIYEFGITFIISKRFVGFVGTITRAKCISLN